MRVDPGPHVLVFRSKGRVEARLEVLVKEGEKSLLVEATLPLVPSAAPRLTPVHDPGARVDDAGGVAVLALGGFVQLTMARSDVHAMQDTCQARRCPPDDVDRRRRARGVGARGRLRSGSALLATGVSISGSCGTARASRAWRWGPGR